MNRLDNLDAYVQTVMQSWSCPGVALSIVRGDEVLHQGAYGLGDIENQVALTAGTRFAMASVTKSFTAMSVALLVDEGKLDWDKPVQEYMPEFILDDAYATRHLTIRDMLSHRTGLPRHDLAAWRLDISRAEFVQRMRYLKFSATFREKFQYNNLMYVAAAHLVEKLAGQKWEDFVQARIFGPLGMSASNFLPEPPRAGQLNALGYRTEYDEAGAAKAQIRMPFGKYTEVTPGAAGALFSTLADLTQWLKVHVNAGRAGQVQLVSPGNLKQMHQPHTIVPSGGISEALMGNTIFTYGIGWGIDPYRGYTLVSHGGNLEGHSLVIGFVPQENLGVIVLTNIAGMPVRDVLLYEAVDRALDLPDRDWNAKFHGLMDPFILGHEKSKQTAEAERVAEAPPSHPLETYVGEYEAKGYPVFAVRQAAGGLEACTVGGFDWFELRHYHYDVFQWHLVTFDIWITLRFLVNDSGDVESVSIPMEPAVENIVFTRKPVTLSADLLAALVGEYPMPVAGLTFTITARDGKAYLAAGGYPEEIKPFKLTADWVCFMFNRTRFEFAREGDAITRLVMKNPGMTLEAPKAGGPKTA